MSGASDEPGSKAGLPDSKPIEGHGYRAELSFTFAVPKAKFVVWERLKEFWTDLNLSLKKSETAVGADRFNRDETHDGLALATGGDLNVLPLSAR
ncbi:MAG: hypothetical protein WDM87_05090 [Terracidiphilus sp.]